MISVLIIMLVAVLGIMVVAIFLLGFRLGGGHSQNELSRVRLESAQAQRRLHDLTREAFVAMAEQVESRRGGPVVRHDRGLQR